LTYLILTFDSCMKSPVVELRQMILLVLLATLCWQNHYHISVLLKQGRCNYSESSNYSERIFSTMERPWYDKYQCHKYLEGNFWIPGRFCTVYNSAKVDSLVAVQTAQRKDWTPISVREDFEQLSRHGWLQHATVQTVGQHHPDAETEV